MTKIASVAARRLLDCKARPLVEVETTTDNGHVGRGASPTGCSIGEHEALGAELDDPRTPDRVLIELDSTPDKHRLGGNAICSTSIALLGLKIGS